MKSFGYATGQFGKNHLGDRNEHLPTVHGFDEFFGNLYHLNAEEEPENPDYPKDPGFRAKFGPRGVLKTGPLIRMIRLSIPRSGVSAGRRSKILARLNQADGNNRRGISRWGQGFHQPSTDGRNTLVLLFQLDAYARLHTFEKIIARQDRARPLSGRHGGGRRTVGELLKLIDDLGVANNTIVVYTSDNGAEAFTWPDGGSTPFRSEKATNFEGAFRVPCLIRWPGVIAPGAIVNDICAPGLDPDIRCGGRRGGPRG